ncbi:MAG: hypothetical protein QQN63_01960 [Nitrosopumilus sp.]
MLNIEVEDKTYQAPEDWHELECGKFQEWSEYAENNMPQVLKDKYFEGKEIELTEAHELECLKWYGQFVNHCTGLVVKDLPMSTEDGFGVVDLYHHLFKFLLTPEEPTDLTGFSHNGKAYRRKDKVLDPLGKEIPMKGATYGEYEEQATLVDQFSKLKKGLNYLHYLTAMIYTNEDVLDKRAKDFKTLPMDKVWSGYFFLGTHLTTLTKSLQHYLGEVSKVQGRVLSRMVG